MLLYKQEEKLKTEMAWKEDDVGVWDQPHAFVLWVSGTNLQLPICQFANFMGMVVSRTNFMDTSIRNLT
jgi:hypothetical protein